MNGKEKMAAYCLLALPWVQKKRDRRNNEKDGLR